MNITTGTYSPKDQHPTTKFCRVQGPGVWGVKWGSKGHMGVLRGRGGPKGDLNGNGRERTGEDGRREMGDTS
eukprot:1234557-Prymnesium_polylepis.1